MSATIAQSVSNLQTDLRNIKNAVRNKGVSIASNAGFGSIASYINQIPTSNIAKIYGRFQRCSLGQYMRTGSNNVVTHDDCYAFYRYYSDNAPGSDIIDIGPYVPNIWNLPVGIYPCADTYDVCGSMYNQNSIVYEWSYRPTASSGTPTTDWESVSGITHIKINSPGTIQYSTDNGATWVYASRTVNITANQYVDYSVAKIYINIQTISELTANYANNEVQAWDSINAGLVDLVSFSPDTGVYRVAAHKRVAGYDDQTVYVTIDGGTSGSPDYALGMIKYP